jgi:hypothetical protein
MNKHLTAVFWSMLFLCPLSGAAGALDPERYLAQRGWTPFEGSKPVQLPQAGIAVLRYYEQGRSVPSCGILTAGSERATPHFIDLVSSDAGENYPQCLGIGPIAQFRLQGRVYAVVGYDFRETGQDFYRSYHYLYEDGQQGYVSDKALNRLVPDIDLQEAEESGRKRTDGVKAAHRLLQGSVPAPALPGARFHLGPTVIVRHVRQPPDTPMLPGAGNWLGTGPGRAYGIHAGSAMQRGTCHDGARQGGHHLLPRTARHGRRKQLAAIASVTRAGKITLEKALTSAVNTSGATGNARTAKAALSKLLH